MGLWVVACCRLYGANPRVLSIPASAQKVTRSEWVFGKPFSAENNPFVCQNGSILEASVDHHGQRMLPVTSPTKRIV
jgi:hypothetical protein